MSLNYNFTKVENSKELWVAIDPNKPEGQREFRLHHVTEGLVWASMILGFSTVTEQNIDTIYNRNVYAMKLGLWYAVRDNERNPITREDIRRHLNMETNADSLTRLQFIKRMAKIFEDKAQAEL